MLIDTHCHLHDREFFSAEQAEAMLIKARQNGVGQVVCIGTSVKDSLAARDFAITHDGVYWTFGVHPENCGEVNSEANWQELLVSKRDKLVATGEVGLDYHQAGYDRAAQIRLFEEMLQLARDLDLPLSFHVREAFSDFLAIVANFTGVRGVVHSFTDNKKNLRKILENTDFYVGVNGLATYSTLPMPPLERVLLETDAPFLTPIPFRGIINESAYIRNIAEWMAVKMGVEFSKIEQETTKNAKNLFHFSDTVLRP